MYQLLNLFSFRCISEVRGGARYTHFIPYIHDLTLLRSHKLDVSYRKTSFRFVIRPTDQLYCADGSLL